MPRKPTSQQNGSCFAGQAVWADVIGCHVLDAALTLGTLGNSACVGHHLPGISGPALGINNVVTDTPRCACLLCCSPCLLHVLLPNCCSLPAASALDSQQVLQLFKAAAKYDGVEAAKPRNRPEGDDSDAEDDDAPQLRCPCMRHWLSG
jgi:hypothetical protein